MAKARNVAKEETRRSPRKLAGKVVAHFILDLTDVDRQSLAKENVTNRDSFNEWCRALIMGRLDELGGKEKVALLQARLAQFEQEKARIEARIAELQGESEAA